jgi:DNA-binding NtrC family response regulator
MEFAMSSHAADFAEILSDADLRGVRVLAVEDCWPTATAVEARLDELGMEVVGPAATISDAQRLAAGHRPEMAVIDINLRGEMAYALIDLLHSQGVRVVVVTGYAVLPEATAKIAAILRKPFSTPALRAALRHGRFPSVCTGLPSSAPT